MKEIAASAAALAGLITFAYVAQLPQSSLREKRSSIEIDSIIEDDHEIIGEMFEGNFTENQFDTIMADLYADDVQPKANVRAKVKSRDIPALHDQMNVAWAYRFNQADARMTSAGILNREGNCDDNKFIQQSCNDCSADPTGCFDYSDNHNKVAEIVGGNKHGSQIFGNDGKGRSYFHYVAPRAIPLNSGSADGHLADYEHYLKGFRALEQAEHFQKDMYFSYTIWQNGAAAAPRNAKYHTKTFSKLKTKMEKFWKKPGPITIQPMYRKSLDVFAKSILGRNVHNTPDNNSQASRNCFVMWFHQDVPKDLSTYVSGGVSAGGMGGDQETFDIGRRCTYAHIFVSPEVDGAGNEASRVQVTKRMHAALTGASRVALVDNYSGHFFLNSYQDVSSPVFHQKVMNYFWAARQRRLCQLSGNPWAPTEDAEDYAPDQTYDNIQDYLGESYESEEYTAEESEYNDAIATAAPEEDVEYGDAYSDTFADLDNMDTAEAAPPPVDRCCGHNNDNLAYASQGEKSCCYDSTSDPSGLSPFLTTGGCAQ